MATYHNSKNSEGVCEKIRNATLSPIFRKIRSSVRPQNYTPTNTTPKFPLPTNNPTSVEIPIESSPQLLPTRPNNRQVREVAIVTPTNEPKTRGPLRGQQLIKPKVDTGSLMKANGKPTHNNEEGGSKKLGQEDVNGKSSAYIDRVKNKMRTKSNVVGEKNLGRRDSFNDKVSNFINKAKIKLRTTSSFGGGK